MAENEVGKLFERLSDNLESFEAYVMDNCQESHTLDFKRDPKVASQGKLSAVFAEIATAFANADGGIIVWGVDKKAGKPAKFEPVENIVQFSDQISGLSGQIAAPALRGLLNKPLTKENGTGYLLTYVPASSDRPHMAMGKDQKKYFIRSGESTNVMDHQQVRDAILAKSTPELSLNMWNYCTLTASGGTESKNTITFYVRNISNITASKLIVFCHADVDGDYYFEGASRGLTYQDHRFAPRTNFKTAQPHEPGLLHPGSQFAIPFQYRSIHRNVTLTFIVSSTNYTVVFRATINLPSELTNEADPRCKLIKIPPISVDEQLDFFRGGSIPPCQEINVHETYFMDLKQ